MKTKRFQQSILIITLWLIALMIQSVAFAAEGKLVYDKVHSLALEGNLLGDSADRSVTIYLPPGYDEDTDVRYPVVYLLHGYTADNTLWTGSGYIPGLNIKNIADSLIQQGKIKPMILVAPDANNKYWGSWYTNSSATGNWEDFIAQDLVQHVDSTYRTLPQAQSRGITGHSMGSIGALQLAMKHPEVYSAVYGLSGFTITEADWIKDKNAWSPTLSLKEMNQFWGASFFTKAQISMSAAFSPNPNRPPFFADFLFEWIDGELKRVESAWQKWSAQEPAVMVRSHQENLRRLRAIRHDIGTSDSPEIPRTFAQALTDTGIPHVFEEYPGDHTNRISERMETKVLPFFSEVLAFEMLSVETNVQPRGKLTTTWGEMKHGR